MESYKRLKKVIFEQQIKLWRAGCAELEFVFAYLVAELVFSRENPAEWEIVLSSVDVREINSVLRRVEETIRKLFKSKSFFWGNWRFLRSKKIPQKFSQNLIAMLTCLFSPLMFLIGSSWKRVPLLFRAPSEFSFSSVTTKKIKRQTTFTNLNFQMNRKE